MEIVGGDWARIGQVGIVFVMTLARARAAALGEAARLAAGRPRQASVRASLRLSPGMAALHRHGRPPGRGPAPRSSERVVKALADIGGAPGGPAAALRRAIAGSPRRPLELDAARCPRRRGRGGAARAMSRAAASSLDFDAVRDGLAGRRRDARPGARLARRDRARLGRHPADPRRPAGRPRHPRTSAPSAAALDWEDFDLFRTAGIQAATYIAEARGQQALADAQRFDEFNRRFAFIMHDIKNLVSQLSLVAAQCRAPCRQSRIPRRHDRDAAKLGQQDERPARPPLAAARRARPSRRAPVEVAAAASTRSPRPGAASIRSRSSGDAGAGRAWPIRPASSRRSAISSRTRSRRAPPTSRSMLRCFESGGDVADRGDRPRPRHVGRLRPRPACSSPSSRPRNRASASAPIEARALIRAMGGRLDVESRRRRGHPLHPLPAARPRPRRPIIYERMRA